MPSILFISGSCEPGRDGVGDYSRQLAAELQRMRCQVTLIASHDQQAQVVITENQQEGTETIEVLRIPKHIAEGERLRLLNERIAAFTPEWISLQYVPHSFNDYGLPFRFIRSLRKVKTAAKWQVMFHELWVPNPGPTKPKNWLISGLSCLATTLLGRRSLFTVRHTHLPYYQQLLEDKGIKTLPLPLHSNINCTCDRAEKKDDAPLRIAFFSQMDLFEPVIVFLRSLLEDELAQGRPPIKIVLLGGGPKKVARTATELREALPAANVTPVGFLSATNLSAQLKHIHYGISPVESFKLGKSGSAAVFLHHRLPVIAPVSANGSKRFFHPALEEAIVSSYSREGMVAARAAALNLNPDLTSAGGTARRFLRDLGFQTPSFQPVNTSSKNTSFV